MYRNIKPCLDFTMAFILLILVFPIMIIIGFLIKLESKGPLIFIQKRAGLNGGYFKIYKFRSMKIGTPDLPTDQISDPSTYVTKVGRLLRKTSLDELPQLFNILKGDMSFIGPRPALYNQYQLIEDRRLRGIDCIKPGLTGYAQVMGRDSISDAEKIQYDLFYLQNLTLFFDLKIILSTFKKVAMSENIKA